MPSITINGVKTDFSPGQTILQVANRLQKEGKAIEIPQYCYHDGLSIAANCRICLVEVWSPNAKSGQLEPFMGGKLLPSCQQTAADGMVVYADSPKAVANQKAVMEYLLINHPLDCPVCDQAGECWLQDYSYKYGRGVSRFEEQKVKNPKKDLGPHVYLYADRCIMCTRCVRFTREVTGTGELLVTGRGNKEEIDVFTGVGIANELSANVTDICPVGALLEKDFLFAQRVWFLKTTPSIDGITASGDNIFVEHNEGKIYRIKPRENLAVNTFWITDEVRFGWKHVHAEQRLRSPFRRQYGTLVECEWSRAYEDALSGLKKATSLGASTAGKRLLVIVSPNLSCEEAFALATLARTLDPNAVLAVGAVPVRGQDKVFPNKPAEQRFGIKDGFRVYAEKAPNARGVRRVLEAIAGAGNVLDDAGTLRALGSGSAHSDIGAVIVTGNYTPENADAFATEQLRQALGGKFVVLLDTFASSLLDATNVFLPASTWIEKAGVFENAKNKLQAFEQAIQPIEGTRPEGQIAFDLLHLNALGGQYENALSNARGPAGSTTIAPRPETFKAANVRQLMAERHEPLRVFVTSVSFPEVSAQQQPDMELIEI
ncbi:MAG: molybdopterin-dependent oxidoreductase [Planctomycetota bacterium]|nr:molybdopterin-dependent oxidoreductase [Planctomycetota bacterium]